MSPEPEAGRFLKAFIGLIAAAWMLLPPWANTTRSKISSAITSLISATPSTRAEMCTSK